jgi:hypothetical protein
MSTINEPTQEQLYGLVESYLNGLLPDSAMLGVNSGGFSQEGFGELDW